MKLDFIKDLDFRVVIPIMLLIPLLKWLSSWILGFLSWKPREPLKNKEAKSNIKDYPQDYEIDFKSKRIKNVINGEKSFIQSLILFITTEKNKYRIFSENYGCEQASVIFKTKSPLEFNRLSMYLAQEIITNSRFVDYIEEIYSIKRSFLNLTIELKVKGKANTLICKIPMKIGKECAQ